MRAFLVLSYAVCLVVARPQTGYNYEPNHGFPQPTFYSSPLVSQAQPSIAPVTAYSGREQLQTFQSFPTAATPLEHSYSAQSHFLPLPTTPATFLPQASYSPSQNFIEQPAFVQQPAPAYVQQPTQYYSANFNGLTAYNTQHLQADIPAVATDANIPNGQQIAFNAAIPQATAATPTEFVQQQQHFVSHLAHDVSHDDARAFAVPAQQAQFVQTEAIQAAPAPLFSTNFNAFDAQSIHAEIPAATIPQAPLSTPITPTTTFAQQPISQTETFGPSPADIAPAAPQAPLSTALPAIDDSAALAAPTQQAAPAQAETFGPSPADIAPAAPTESKENDSISVEAPETPSPAIPTEPAQLAPELPAQAIPELPAPQLPSQHFQDTQPRYQDAPQAQTTGTTTIHKHIYVHVPPPDIEEQEPQVLQQPIVNRNKHYKIIFIKAPSTPQAKYIAAPQVLNEDKTLVYVLVKKPELAHEILQPVEQPEVKRDKPEVYFIKYKAKKESIPAPIDTAVPNEEIVVDARANTAQLGDSNALAETDAAPSAETNVNIELPAADAPADRPSFELSKKYIPA